jgi:hypothetical protein
MADVLAKYRASAVIQLDLIAVNPDFKPSLTYEEGNSISRLTVDAAERAKVAAILARVRAEADAAGGDQQ